MAPRLQAGDYVYVFIRPIYGFAPAFSIGVIAAVVSGGSHVSYNVWSEGSKTASYGHRRPIRIVPTFAGVVTPGAEAEGY